MTTDDHIATIKEHLKAIEAENQAKKEPKRYLIVETKETSLDNLILKAHFAAIRHSKFTSDLATQRIWDLEKEIEALSYIILSGKIITINEE